MDAPGTLVLLRHGESTYNARGLLTGLLDVPLTDQGRQEALHAASLLGRARLVPELIYTSVLTRAQQTTEIVRSALGRSNVPIHALWQLNERNYGALTGRSKAAVLAVYGSENFVLWRRTLTGEPPPMDESLLRDIRAQPAFEHLPSNAVTATESLDDVRARIEPFWRSSLRRELAGGSMALVVAHGNSLRALCAVVDQLGEKEIVELNIPTGHPLVYRFDDGLRPLVRGGSYLDPAAAGAAAQMVADAGGT